MLIEAKHVGRYRWHSSIGRYASTSRSKDIVRLPVGIDELSISVLYNRPIAYGCIA